MPSFLTMPMFGQTGLPWGWIVQALALLALWLLLSRHRARAALERCRLQAARRDLEVRSLYEAACVMEHGIAITDPLGRLEWCNQSFSRQTGYSQQESLGRDQLTLLGAGDEALRPLRDRLAKGSSCSCELFCKGKDGVMYRADLAFRAMHLDGRLQCYLVVLRDVTERHERLAERTQLQQELAAAWRIARAAVLGSGALQSIADQMAQVAISAELLDNRIATSAANRLGNVTEVIAEHQGDWPAFLDSERGRHLPEFLTEVSRRLSSEQVSMLSEVRSLQANVAALRNVIEVHLQHAADAGGVNPSAALNAIVRDAVQAVCPTRKSPLTCQWLLDEQLPAALADHQKTMQILINLVSNAKRATAGCEDPQLQIRTFCEAGRVVVELTDNGCGIPDDDVPRVFRRGYSTWREGRGFGLYCSRRAAREMGGSLTVESRGRQRGATFRLELPVAAELDCPSPPSGTAAEVGASASSP